MAGMGAVIVLHVALPGQPAAGWMEAWLEALPYAKRLETERREPGARFASLAGIALALVLAGRLSAGPARAGELRFPTPGKPFMPGGPHFSISHTTGLVACAASADLDCGLDVEAIGADATEGARQRLQRWTATEAVLKAAGLGLREVRDVEIAADGRSALARGETFSISELSLAPGLVAHLAARRAPDRVTVEQLMSVPGAPRP
jgi:phosphopantetheinyl transferase